MAAELSSEIKMVDVKVLDAINLNSYTSSPNYFGYFETIKGPIAKDKEPVLLFKKYLEESDINKINCITNISFNSYEELIDLYGLTKKKIKEYYSPLLKKNIADDQRIDPDWVLNFKSFDLKLDEYEIVDKLFNIIINFGGSYGHTFIIIEPSLIIYAHDDGGFGIISKDGNLQPCHHVFNFFKKEAPAVYEYYYWINGEKIKNNLIEI